MDRVARPRRLVLSVDLEHRGMAYRIAESIRERSSIRPMERDMVPCSGCDRVIRRYASYLQTPTLNVHPQCAITAGLLTLVGRSVETPAPPAEAVL